MFRYSFIMNLLTSKRTLIFSEFSVKSSLLSQKVVNIWLEHRLHSKLGTVVRTSELVQISLKLKIKNCRYIFILLFFYKLWASPKNYSLIQLTNTTLLEKRCNRTFADLRKVKGRKLLDWNKSLERNRRPNNG